MNKRIIVLILLAANILLLGWWFLWGKARYATSTVTPEQLVSPSWKPDQRPGYPNARVTMCVIGEDGSPLPGVTASFVSQTTAKHNAVLLHGTGKTDMAGHFMAIGYAQDQFEFILEKSGYYVSCPSFTVFRDLKEFHSGPWDVTHTNVLRKIGKPVAMYARKCHKSIPDIQKPCGFDLEVGDWVAPFGEGKVTDLIVTVQREHTNQDQFSASANISFSNPLDGIQEVKLPEEWRCSEFKWLRLAPEIGYQPGFSTQSKAEPGRVLFNSNARDQAYFFRVRTAQRNGRIASALYGKIKGGIGFEGSETKTCSMAFTYYLNPTPLDQNMEFDPKRNLMKDLKPLEGVEAP
jgi:hypothetical protein